MLDGTPPAGMPVIPETPPRRLVLAALGALLFLPRLGLAMWTRLDNDELIRKSDLIVMGEWMGQTRITVSSAELDVGVINITEVLKGTQVQALVMVGTSSPQAPRSSTDISYKRGDKGLWLLRLRPDSKGIYLADHPQRFVPSGSGDAIISEIRRLIHP